ncbi:AbrB/MazE/SpoVT family DNA-binding domain-containing protein [Thermoplasmatales archaeon AK]|nr:AbrB/MazE/SpoVT family DNA-binding domain-containing protein [Thermoplasmatales archaeon AK]
MELVETRKLLPRGNRSLDVVLPAWWIKAHYLKKGSRVRVITTPDRIIIEPEGKEVV